MAISLLKMKEKIDFLKGSLKDYLKKLGEKSPVPGGGSASAVCGSLSASLCKMVINFSQNLEGLLIQMEEIEGKVNSLIEEDSKAYLKVREALSLPKATEEEKKKRRVILEETLKEASLVPFQIAGFCAKILKIDKALLQKGNKNLISDVGVSAILARSSIESAFLNAEINYSFIKDKGFVMKERDRFQRLLASSSPLAEKIIKSVKGLI